MISLKFFIGIYEFRFAICDRDVMDNRSNDLPQIRRCDNYSEIANRKSKIANKKPRQTARLLKIQIRLGCLADYLTWSQVALTHHELLTAIMAFRSNRVKRSTITADTSGKNTSSARLVQYA